MTSTQNIMSLLEAMFQLSAFFTAILFSIYVFVIVASNPFIEKIQGTKAYANCKRHIRNTLGWGMLITVSSVLVSLANAPIVLQGGLLVLSGFCIVWLVMMIDCIRKFHVIAG